MKQRFLKGLCPKLAVLFAAFAILPVFWACSDGISSSGLGKAKDAVPFMTNARTGVLSSGMRYYLLENSKPEGRAFLTLAVNAGSVLEEENERGLAHFVEHMAFNGTTRFQKSELVNYLRSLGMRFGPEVNAYTSFDETVYGIEVPIEADINGRGLIPKRALEVIDDWARAVSFYKEDVDKERLVVLEEYRSRLGARDRMNREILPFLLRGSAYADRIPIGLPEVIESAPAERLEAFYRKWYRPENMAVIIVGDFDAAYLEENIEGFFPAASGWVTPPDGPAFKRPEYDLPAPKKGSLETLVLTDSELSGSRIQLYWKRQAKSPGQDLASYRESLIDYLADLMLSLRFEEETVKPETPYIYADSGMANYGYSSRFYVFVAQAKAASARETLEKFFLIKEELSRYGFTQVEKDIAQESLLSYLEQLVSEKDRQNSETHVRAFTRHFLEGETVPDLEWELEAAKKLLPGISVKEINKRVKGYFADDDLTVIISAPEAEVDNLPDKEEIRKMAAEGRRAKIAPPKKSKPEGELLAYAPEGGSIIAETSENDVSGSAVIRWKLGNGAEVILKETANKNSEISFYAQALGGTLSVSDEMDVSAALAAEMLNVSGLGPFSLPELTKILSDRQVSMALWTQGFLRGAQGTAAVKDIKTLFEMIHISFTQPRFDSDAVKALLDKKRSTMAFQENDPDIIFRREISRTINGNQRLHPLNIEDLDKVSTDDAMAFIKSALNPGDFCFVFTGNIELSVMRQLVETYIASIPASEPFKKRLDIDPRRPLDVTKEVRKGKEEKSLVYFSWYKNELFSEEKAAAVSVLSDYLDIVLEEEIRENLGGVYSISSWVSLSPLPKGELSGGVFFVCDPRRISELVTAVKNEFQKIAQEKIDVDVFAKAVEANIKGHEQSVQSNFYLAQSYANSAVIYNSPMSRLDKRPGLYRKVSHSDIQKTAALLLSGGRAQLVLLPE